jgi:hypothetical protein
MAAMPKVSENFRWNAELDLFSVSPISEDFGVAVMTPAQLIQKLKL